MSWSCLDHHDLMGLMAGLSGSKVCMLRHHKSLAARKASTQPLSIITGVCSSVLQGQPHLSISEAVELKADT